MLKQHRECWFQKLVNKSSLQLHLALMTKVQSLGLHYTDLYHS